MVKIKRICGTRQNIKNIRKALVKKQSPAQMTTGRGCVGMLYNRPANQRLTYYLVVFIQYIIPFLTMIYRLFTRMYVTAKLLTKVQEKGGKIKKCMVFLLKLLFISNWYHSESPALGEFVKHFLEGLVCICFYIFFVFC